MGRRIRARLYKSIFWRRVYCRLKFWEYYINSWLLIKYKYLSRWLNSYIDNTYSLEYSISLVFKLAVILLLAVLAVIKFLLIIKKENFLQHFIFFIKKLKKLLVNYIEYQVTSIGLSLILIKGLITAYVKKFLSYNFIKIQPSKLFNPLQIYIWKFWLIFSYLTKKGAINSTQNIKMPPYISFLLGFNFNTYNFLNKNFLNLLFIYTKVLRYNALNLNKNLKFKDIRLIVKNKDSYKYIIIFRYKVFFILYKFLLKHFNGQKKIVEKC